MEEFNEVCIVSIFNGYPSKMQLINIKDIQ